MKKLVSIIVISLGILTAAAYGQNAERRRVANAVGDGFAADLRPLDRKGLQHGGFSVLYQYWITDIDQKEYESRRFGSFTAFENWLRKNTRKEDNTPFRVAGNVKNCTATNCTIETGNMRHNHLFLKRVWFAYRRGKPIVRKIHLIYG
ncbi:MAG: hypothetical protein QM785_11695 [Pyrinomonadaceae bacterium]